ncbi:MAG TPA: ABC transporter permease [Bryobacteraceae bacterium]|jgi:putative ABC transport system permease protein
MSLVQDLRYGLRQLRGSPAFTLAAVLTLALGIGANTAIFSVADAVLLRPLPYPNPRRLVMVWNELTRLNVHQMELSPNDFDAFRADTHIFDTAAGFAVRDRNLIGDSDAERVSTIAFTPGLLEMLGARMSAGRVFQKDDWNADRNDVAIISHALFVRRFAGDGAVVGRKIRLDDRLLTVVGVLAPEFEFSFGAGGFDVWTPFLPSPDRRARQYRMLARMAPGISFEAAQSYVAATAQRLKETLHPYEGPNGEDGGYRARVVSLHDQLLHDFRAGTLVLLSAVALVLLIACANVANLLLARASAREKEVAIRRALGASRLRLVRQWLTEASLLATIGGVAGVALSFWGVRLLRAMSPAELPVVARIDVDVRALLFTLLVSIAACVLFSSAPLLAVLRMTGSLRGPRRRNIASGVLVAGEVALAVVLLAGSGLLLKSFAQLRRIDPGVRTDHLLTMLVDLTGARYQEAGARVRLFAEFQERLSKLPGVVAVSSTDRLPIFTVGVDTRTGNPFSLDGRPFDPDAAARQQAHTGTVGLGYFQAMGIPVLQGREFRPVDTRDAEPVAVINQVLARTFFPGKDPVGRRILFGLPAPGAKWLKIVGVVGNVRTGALDLPPFPQFYTPEMQEGAARMYVVVRTVTEPLAAAREARDVLYRLDPELTASQVATMEDRVAAAVGQPRYRTLLLLFFGATSLFLAAVGIYGVVTHAVVQRTQEIGIRMALGANPVQVTANVLRAALIPVAAGVVAGFAGTTVVVRFLRSMLFGVSPGDPSALSGAAVLLALVALTACMVPARRASRLEPMAALRYE